MSQIKLLPKSQTLYVVSADFSHFLPLSQAIPLENKAAHSLMFRDLRFTEIVDHIDNFKVLFNILPNKYHLQWIGRTRSDGEKGVGYLSFLIRKDQKPNHPDGFFITAYDTDMNARECLGDLTNWNKQLQHDLLKKVSRRARHHSRLTNGKKLDIPVKYYTITYLYRDSSPKFIRGWHSILNGAFFLSDVLLQHTFNNGNWITPQDTHWPKNNHFKLTETLHRLSQKAKRPVFPNESTYYYSEVKYLKKKVLGGLE